MAKLRNSSCYGIGTPLEFGVIFFWWGGFQWCVLGDIFQVKRNFRMHWNLPVCGWCGISFLKQFYRSILWIETRRGFCWDGHPAAKKIFQIPKSQFVIFKAALYTGPYLHIVDPPPSQSRVNVFRYSLLKVTKHVMSSWWSLWVHFWCSKVDWAIGQPGYSPKTNASMSH